MHKSDNFSSIPQALEELQNGNMLIVVDDPSRENQGDIIFPAATVTIEKANFLIQQARGMFCVPMTKQKAAQLGITPMVALSENTEKLQCNFGITVDSKKVTSHGISAHDRFITVKTLSEENATANDFLKPGHVFPIIAMDGGVLERNGHTEAAVDLAQLAGFPPIGVLSEILTDQGDPAQGDELIAFANRHNLKIITIHDLIEYRKTHPLPKEHQLSSVRQVSQAQLPTKFGQFIITIYQDITDNKEHAVLTVGDLEQEPICTRIHSQCLTGDTFSSLRCDCEEQLHESMKVIQQQGKGIILYLNQEGRGIGLANKIKAYALQEQGYDTVEANHLLGFATDERDYKIAADMLHDLGISKINLLTNNPKKIEAIRQYDIEIVNRVPIEIKPNNFNKNYLETKKTKLHHQLTEV